MVWAEQTKRWFFRMGRKNPVHGSFVPLKKNEKDVITALFFTGSKSAEIVIFRKSGKKTSFI